MINYQEELVLNIQGLGVGIHTCFTEIDSHHCVDIPPDVDIHTITIQKIGGYVPRLTQIVYLDKEYQERQQAYMANWSEGNLRLIPIYDEQDIAHSFGQEQTLYMTPIGIVLHIPSNHFLSKGWLSLYQGGKHAISCGYELINGEVTTPTFLET